jgi:hypothetical protein
MDDSEFLTSLFERTLPKHDWTHEAHLRFGWLLTNRFEFAEALHIAREKIDSYNQKVGANVGYHETITRAFLHLISSRKQETPCTSFEEFKTRNADLFETKLKVLFQYYSNEVLWSPQSKTIFVEPDLKPLPRL